MSLHKLVLIYGPFESMIFFPEKSKPKVSSSSMIGYVSPIEVDVLSSKILKCS